MQPALTPAAARPAFTQPRYLVTLGFVTSLFMLWGVGITLGDVLNRHFQQVLHVSKADSALVQFSIFGAYFVMGLPAGWFMNRFGYQRGVLLGLGLYAAGAFLMIPAAGAGSFGGLRIALFVLACGLATLEAVAHPFLDGLGDTRSSDRRITFAHAINGIGAISGPLIGGYFILRSGTSDTDLTAVKTLYLIIGLVVASVGIAFSFVKVPPLVVDHETTGLPESPTNATADKKLFQHKHFVWACVAQLFNVAAQGGTWAFFINYGVAYMPGMSDAQASYFFSLSLGLMMLGRFLGTYLMQFIAPNRLLAVAAFANLCLCFIIAQHWGWVSFVALMGLNLFFSIMFPTIYSLGLKDLGRHKGLGSSFIVMGVVGGALFPRLMGIVANHSVAEAYYLPIICYAVVFLFAIRLYRVRST